MILRGKKNTDKKLMISTLKKLVDVAKTPYQTARVLLSLIPAQFDYNPGIAGYMAIEIWRRYFFIL